MRVLLRCDGGPGTGVGHVVRCLALAEEALARGHEVVVSGRLEGDLLDGLLAALRAGGGGPGVVDPADGAELAALALDHDVVHVDHYELDPTLYRAVGDLAAARGVQPPVVSVTTDGGFGAQPADVLLDPTVGAQDDPPPAPARWHLRGSRFVVLRSSVGSAPSRVPPDDGGPLRVLVVMGGTDPLACAPLVAAGLERTGVDVEVTAVTTPATAPALTALAGRWRHGVLHPVPPLPDLPAAMAAADVVVTAAGTSTWELCALGATMAVVAVVPNQRAGHDRVVAAGAALGLGGPDDLTDPDALAARLRPLLVDGSVRERLGAAASALVDGLGAWRVVRLLEEAVAAGPTSQGPVVTVREATAADADLLLEWRNDPTTRAVSRSHEVVARADHVAWLASSTARPDRHLLVGEADGVPVGTVRWDEEGHGEWEVSITVAPRARGRRVAGSLLAAGEGWLVAHRPGVRGHLAVVHVDNEPSRRLFLGAGYVPDLPADADGFERFVRCVRRGPT